PHQGIGAELMASRWGFDRAALDAFAAESHGRDGGSIQGRDRAGRPARRWRTPGRRDRPGGHDGRGPGRARVGVHRQLGVDLTTVNPRGGAIALGYPLGASGTRLLTTIVNQLKSSGAASACKPCARAAGWRTPPLW